MKNKQLLVLVIASLVIIGSTVLFVLNSAKLSSATKPEVQVERIVKQGIDYSHSLFPPDQTEALKKEIDEQLASFVDGRARTVENLVSVARLVRDVRDMDSALTLFAIADTMYPKDLFYKIDVGRIYLERQQWEQARQVFEPMKVTWPVHEAYLGLAEAYQHIEGTPNYVVDQIYEESLFRHDNNFEVLEAYAEWLEETDRGAESIKYYEMMQRLAPQPALEQKIKELKAQYPSAK